MESTVDIASLLRSELAVPEAQGLSCARVQTRTLSVCRLANGHHCLSVSENHGPTLLFELDAAAREHLVRLLS